MVGQTSEHNKEERRRGIAGQEEDEEILLTFSGPQRARAERCACDKRCKYNYSKRKVRKSD